MAIGDMYRVDVHSRLQGNPNVMCFNAYVQRDPDTLSIAADLLLYFKTTFVPGLAAFQTQSKQWECLTVQLQLKESELCPVLGLVETESIAILGGLATPPALPGQCSLCVQTLTTDFPPNPSNRGRDFWYGWVEAQQANGAWLDATWQLLEAHLHATLFGGWITPDAGEYQWVNWSAKTSAQRCALPGGTDPLTAIDAWSNIQQLRALKHVRTQRRRQPENPCDKFSPNLL